jgi:hypothetical protein
VDYEDKTDSLGNVIERSVIYKTVSATVTEEVVIKVADWDM